MLPIETIFPALQACLQQRQQQIILQAPTGAGKSTALPLYLLGLDQLISGKIILLEPRRLAAKNIAHYLAEQLNQNVGETVGYRMRGETQVSAHTRLEIVTEGVLTRMLQADPELTGVSMVIFDEFHERNLQADLGLALCLDVQAGLRDDLFLLVMSATLDNQPLISLMPDAKVLSCEGRMYPVTLYYHGGAQGRYLEQDLAQLLKQVVADETGNILVFLAGKKEIVTLANLLKQQAWHDILICPLYGAMTLAEQRLAIAEPPRGKRKIVLATNIAETSLTIAGISVVVDSMRERRLKLDHKTGIGTLTTRYISQAAATQRMGRAGRVQAGSCYRLINREVYAGLEQHSQPDMMVADLSALVLELAGWGVHQPNSLSWLTPPPAHSWQQAVSLLTQLGALMPSGQLTAHGQAMLAFAGAPREAHMLIAAQALEQQHDLKGLTALAAKLSVLLNLTQNEFDLSRAVEQLLNKTEQHQYQQVLAKLQLREPATLPVELTGLALTLAYPDRLACKRQGQGDTWLLSSGLGVKLYPEHSLFNQSWLLIAQLGGIGQQQELVAFSAAPIALEQLKQYQPHLFQTHQQVSWDSTSAKVKGLQQVRIGAITVSSQPLSVLDPQLRTEALINGMLALPELPLNDAALAYMGLVEYARSLMPELELPELTPARLRATIDTWLAPYLGQLTSLEQVKKLDMLMLIKQSLTWPQQQALADCFPKRYRTPAGSEVAIKYEADKPPSIAVKMQHMFGLNQTPTVAKGRAALTILLLSPAGHPLQTTADLAGFWQGSYQEVKKEMKGRYPKHYWPDDPSAAQATTKTKKYMNAEQ